MMSAISAWRDRPPDKKQAPIPERTAPAIQSISRTNYHPRGRVLQAAMRCLHRLLRRLDPDPFFNSDASLEIDRLTVELETLRAEFKGQA